MTTVIQYATKVAASNFDLPSHTKLSDFRPSTDPLDQTTQLRYDELGRLWRQTNAEGTVTETTYNADGQVTTTKQAVGSSEQRTRTVRYDGYGRLSAELSARGADLLAAAVTQAEIDAIWLAHGTTFQYDAAGRLTATRQPDGQQTWRYYDRSGRLSLSINGEGEVTEYRYNTYGELLDETKFATRVATDGFVGGEIPVEAEPWLVGERGNANNRIITWAYDQRGRVTQSGVTDGATTQTQYTRFGEAVETKTSVDEGKWLVQRVQRDLRGQAVAEWTDSADLNLTQRWNYDLFGRQTEHTDASGQVVSRTYDRLGRQVTVAQAKGMGSSQPISTVTTYDAFDRVWTFTDLSGNLTTYTYDNANRTVTLKTPENIEVQTQHNRFGQTSSVKDGRGNTTYYDYDTDGRLKAVRRPIGGEANT